MDNEGRSMAIKIACQCGKRFKVDDVNVGRRGRCPVCSAVLVVPEVDVWKPHPVVRSPRYNQLSLTARWVAPILVAGIIGVAAYPAYCFLRPAKESPGTKAATTYINAIFNTMVKDKYTNAAIDHTIVTAIKDDPRKLSWLWMARTLIKEKVASASKPGTTEEAKIGWDVVYQFNPVSGQGNILNIFMGVIGSPGTRSGRSEWKKEFQDEAVHAWEVAYADYLDRRGPMENPVTDATQKEIDAMGVRVAAELSISIEELWGILEANSEHPDEMHE
jgi:hypothetical protein